jgi:hypothetical protein
MSAKWHIKNDVKRLTYFTVIAINYDHNVERKVLRPEKALSGLKKNET